MADSDETSSPLKAFGVLLANRVEMLMRAYMREMECRVEKIKLESVIHQGGSNMLTILPEGPGVYAFCCADEFLYVGKSPTQGLRIRVGQHLAPRDLGGTLRQHWCNRNCSDSVCGEKKVCNGSAFQKYQTWLSQHCDVWTISAPCLADVSRADRLEKALVCATQPTLQNPTDIPSDRRRINQSA